MCMVLFLGASDIEKLISMNETINVVEKSFRELGEGTAEMTERGVIGIPDASGWLGIMTAYLRGMNALGTKAVTVFTRNDASGKSTTQGTMLLLDPLSGDLLSIMDATFITAMRTGATTGIATKYLARTDSKIIGIFGAGIQAKTQLMAVSAVREIERVAVYTPTNSRAPRFVEEMSGLLNIQVERVRDLRDAVNSDIIITATTSPTPLFDGELIYPGTHVNCIGAHTKDTRELDSVGIKRGKLIVDLKSSAMKEAGEIIMPIESGELTPDHISAELSDIISGKSTGRENKDEITIFKSTGLSIEDVATAKLVYDKAIKEGIGTEVTL